MATRKFLDLDGLKEYDDLIKDNYVAKQDKPYEGMFLYTTDGYIPHEGETYPLIQVVENPATAYTIPVRSAGGVIRVGTPSNDADAATKKYVDDAATITGGASTIKSSNLTGNRALISNGSGKVAVSAVTSTELGYLGGVTSNVQNQLDKKAGLKTLGMTYINASGNTRTCGNGEVFNSYVENMEIGENGYPVQGNIASGDWSHAEGNQTLASGSFAHAEGNGAVSSGDGSHTEGLVTTASGSYSHAEGGYTTASGSYSHAEGYATTALAYQHAQGHYNSTTNAAAGIQSGTSTDTKCTAFVIGNGTELSPSNAFRITYAGKPYAKSTLTTTGCDYAEYFEWKDLNLNSEDRRGYFVTLDGEQIKIAEPNDYILGIISGQPSIVGNGDEDWLGRYVFDEFGAFVYEDFEYEVEVPEEIQEEVINEETGESTIVAKTIMKTVTKTGTKYKENPNYDPTIPYIHREDRPEWDAVGMLGVLSVRDDGTCEVNGYCKVAEGGIATASETGYRVIKRVNDNIVKVIFR